MLQSQVESVHTLEGQPRSLCHFALVSSKDQSLLCYKTFDLVVTVFLSQGKKGSSGFPGLNGFPGIKVMLLGSENPGLGWWKGEEFP